MNRRITAVLFLLIPTAVAAAGGPPEGEDPFARYLFPPERVMGHAREIGLEDSQRTAIKNEVQKVQPRFLDLQFDMQSEGEKLTRLLRESRVDEARVLAEIDRILGIEKDIKRMQVTLLVRIKNVLTPAQQAKLDELARPGK
jgi:Spy/CpxP family protein refolding chaperone